MFYTPRTIAFVCEIFHPPKEPDAAAVQRVHDKMFRSGMPDYTSFSVASTGAVLSNATSRPGASSQASFLHDRFQFKEELSSLTHEGFADRVRRISEEVAELAGHQIFTAQQVTIRTLVNPRSYKDSREYLKAGMFGFDDEIEAFDREPQLYGMRLVFPPTSDRPHAFSLRIESFNNDPRSLYIENQGSFGPLLVARGLQAVAENVDATYKFIVAQALPFVGRFDARQTTE